MKKQTLVTGLILLMIAVALVGVFDASYISYEHFSGRIPVCSEGFECGKVLTSQWAKIGPVPISVLGLLFYSTVFVLSIFLYLQISLNGLVKRTIAVLPSSLKKTGTIQMLSGFDTKEILITLTSFGFLFSVYLISLMAFIIQAWCLYCLISAITSSVLFFISLALTLVANKQDA